VTDANSVIAADGRGATADYTIRLPRSYRRAPMIAAAAVTAVALTIAIIAALDHGWDVRLWSYAILLVVIALPPWYIGAANARAFTRCGPDGFSTRGFGRLHQCRWSQVQAVSQRKTRSRAGTAYSIVITTKTGEQFKLGAPTSVSISPNPLFAEQLEQFKASCRAAVGAGGGDRP
jgi:hypothetical protein